MTTSKKECYEVQIYLKNLNEWSMLEYHQYSNIEGADLLVKSHKLQIQSFQYLIPEKQDNNWLREQQNLSYRVVKIITTSVEEEGYSPTNFSRVSFRRKGAKKDSSLSLNRGLTPRQVQAFILTNLSESEAETAKIVNCVEIRTIEVVPTAECP